MWSRAGAGSTLGAVKASPIRVWRATAPDADDVGRLLHDFNTEFGEPTPGAAVLAERARGFAESGEMAFLLAGDGPDGIALLRLRPSIWSGTLDAHLEELYVAPPLRGRGIGRALLDATLDTARAAGATRIDLGTSVEDTAAIALYESAGFTNQEGPGGPSMLFYERDL